jgi:hypothetical protein
MIREIVIRKKFPDCSVHVIENLKAESSFLMAVRRCQRPRSPFPGLWYRKTAADFARATFATLAVMQRVERSGSDQERRDARSYCA